MTGECIWEDFGWVLLDRLKDVSAENNQYSKARNMEG